MSTKVYLPAHIREQLEFWAAVGYPLETCGVLVGRQTNGQIQVLQAVPVRNANRERAHDRYEFAAEEFLAADQAAASLGLEIVGIWHSHPDHPAQPSEIDRIRAWHGWSYLILSVQQGQAAELRSWRLLGETFAEETVESWPG
jgi:proteasome lid subunit RPN8/RPN11